MKKLLFVVSLLSLVSIYGDSKQEIAPEVRILQTKIEDCEKIARYNTILSYSVIAVGVSMICISDERLKAFVYSFISWGSVSGILTLWNTLQIKRCQYLFKTLARKRLNSVGEIIEGKYSHLSSNTSYLIHDDLFLLLGLKSGFSELELIDLAKTLGRLDTAYKLKTLILHS